MTSHPPATPTAGPAPWTIARIQQALTNEALIRRFLLDLTHAPEHRVMEVFTAWQRVAATIEANASASPSPDMADHLTRQGGQAAPPRSD